LIERLPDGQFKLKLLIPGIIDIEIKISYQLGVTCLQFPEACAAAAFAAPIAMLEMFRLYDSEQIKEGKEGDAFQHCYWSGLTTLAVGATWAEKVTTRFEATPGNRPKDKEFDLENDRIGRDYAQHLRDSGILKDPRNVPAALNAILAYCQ